tara:strand:+ start:3419 stop:3739 length:321 start_codon:yes stop_codon:yes gene_type:complete
VLDYSWTATIAKISLVSAAIQGGRCQCANTWNALAVTGLLKRAAKVFPSITDKREELVAMGELGEKHGTKEWIERQEEGKKSLLLIGGCGCNIPCIMLSCSASNAY